MEKAWKGLLSVSSHHLPLKENFQFTLKKPFWTLAIFYFISSRVYVKRSENEFNVALKINQKVFT